MNGKASQPVWLHTRAGSDRAAFTLIELLVVIASIAILAAMPPENLWAVTEKWRHGQ